jgi:hypothetical protein
MTMKLSVLGQVINFYLVIISDNYTLKNNSKLRYLYCKR